MTTIFHLVVLFQHYENYGAHTWDGEGQCPQHWKAKGGTDAVVATLTLEQVCSMSPADIEKLAHEKCADHERLDDYYEVFKHSHELVCLDTDLLVRVRDAAAESMYSTRENVVIDVSFELGITEAAARLAMDALDDPELVLPVSEAEEDEWDWAEAA